MIVCLAPLLQRWIPGTLSRNTSGSWWFVGDPCGWTCATVTQCLLIYSDVIVSLYVIDHSKMHNWLHLLLFNAIFALAFASHAAAMFSDPGAVPLPTREESQQVNLSERPRKKTTCYKHCLNPNKPPDAHHCGVCKRCIVKMDHHCPWVNNCVGANNQKFFVLFLLYTCSLCVYALGLIVFRAIACVGHGWDGCAPFISRVPFIIGVVFVALLFGLLTMLICSDQLYSVSIGGTPIDRLKGIKTAPPPSFWMGLETMMGGRANLQWLLPVHQTPDEMQLVPNTEPYLDDDLQNVL